MKHQENITAYLAAFVSELVNCGVTQVVVSPGSRSTPLAMLLAEHPGMHVNVHVDERSAAFFGLGIAKATGDPTAILCTSGTAAANYFPAIVEANLSRVPLIVLTGDRPHELRDVGAPQAIDQIHLYGKHVKWFVEMAPPESSVEMVRYARTVGARAVATALHSPAGPVHLNFPFREPLIPNLENKKSLFQMTEREKGYVGVELGKLQLSDGEYRHVAEAVSCTKKGIIVVGAIEDPTFTEAVIELAGKLQYPVIADPLSQLRSGKHDKTNIIDAYDTFLRNDDAKRVMKPEVILRFGAMPISKALSIFLKENEVATQYVIDGGGDWRDPSQLATHMIYADEVIFCQSISKLVEARESSDYLSTWQQLNLLAKQELNIIRDHQELSEGKIFSLIADLLPKKAALFVGNSMPIRDLDTFFHNNDKSIRIFANRGANGIDGIVSTALGVGTVMQPLYLVLGDLTFFHDLNGLIMSKLYQIPIRIILINNNGGGIFSFLPQANYRDHYEVLFGTPLDLDFSHAVSMYNGSYRTITDWNHFTSSFGQNLENDGLQVLEIMTNREDNLQEHRELWKRVSQEISRFLNGE
jgi:2-succinyl-5-enolpyruvyl-6-hydroxy-3-cyclohexene-1-carboxylate synthase